MSWEINLDKEISKLTSQMDELKRLKDKSIERGRDYYTCKACDRIFHTVMNDYAKEGYCSDCWKKQKEKEEKEFWIDLIGYIIEDFEVEISDIYIDERPRLKKLVLVKDGEKKVLKAEKIMHMIL